MALANLICMDMALDRAEDVWPPHPGSKRLQSHCHPKMSSYQRVVDFIQQQMAVPTWDYQPVPARSDPVQDTAPMQLSEGNLRCISTSLVAQPDHFCVRSILLTF